jgi:hypothetical protein
MTIEQFDQMNANFSLVEFLLLGILFASLMILATVASIYNDHRK